MAKKILFILNFASPEARSYKINSFSMASYLAARELGYEFHINTNSEEVIEKNNDDTVHFHLVEIYRTPLSKETWIAYKQLRGLLKKEHFDAIHCNTPIGGVLGRICGKQAGVRKIIYEAHGFHFYKGAPLKNWLLYYPAERFLAHYSDAIITMNQEDNAAAKKFKLRKNGRVYKVHGVGINLSQWQNEYSSHTNVRSEIGLSEDDIMCISMGDLIVRKNYKTAIKAVAQCKNKKLHYYICGTGPEENNLKRLAEECGVKENVHFLGYRNDICNLLKASDFFLFTTLQEGLPRSLMEAMACGLPAVCSRIRGNTDLIDDGKGGYFFDPDDAAGAAEAINAVLNGSMEQMGNYNMEKIKNFELETVKNEIRKIYEEQIV